MASRKKTASLRIAFVGAGNVATRLALALHAAGAVITTVSSKTGKSAKKLANKTGAAVLTDLKKLGDENDFIVLAVSDRVVEKTAKLISTKSIVVHTSGTTPMKTIAKTSARHGVFYPLQTLSAAKEIDFAQVRFCLESSDKPTMLKLKQLAGMIGAQAIEMNSRQRRSAHLAAVFACNFSNHCYAIAQEILAENKLPADLLQSLIEETALKLRSLPASQAQTGPAIRGDENVLKLHLEMLGKKTGNRKKIYRLMSEDIASVPASDKWKKTSKKR